MAFIERMTLTDTVEIATTPQKVWEFWVNMDANYKSWHPEDHILFRWIKGQPLTEGAVAYAEETVGGRLLKGKVTYTEVAPPRHFCLRPPFPKSLFVYYEYRIEPRGEKTAFIAMTHLRYPAFSRRHVEALLAVGKKHVREEGENMKKILEGE